MTGKKLNLNARDIASAATLAAALSASQGAQADIVERVERTLIPADVPSLELGAAHINGTELPTISITAGNENVAGKIIGANDRNNDYVGVKGSVVTGDNTFVTVDAGYGREGDLTGKSIGTGVNYVTDGGSLFGAKFKHTHVGGINYDPQANSVTYTSSSTNRTSTDMGTRTEDVGNTRNTIQTTKHTDTTTTTTQTDITTINSGRHGSKTNSFSIYGEPNTGDTRPFAELGYTDRKYEDNSREQFGTGTVGIRHYTANGNLGASVSQNFGDNKKTGYNVGGEYKINDSMSFTVSGGRSAEVGNNVMAGFRWVFGGKSGRTAPTVAPTTPSEYMARDIRETTITDIAPANLTDKTKYFQNSTTTSQITSSQTSVDTFQDTIIKSEQIKTMSEQIQEYLGRVKPLADNLGAKNFQIYPTYNIDLSGAPE